jgi:separase
MGMSTDKALASSPPTQEILMVLDKAERLFVKDLAVTSERGGVSRVREAAVSLALIGALQTSLGKPGVKWPVLAASLIGQYFIVGSASEIGLNPSMGK